MRAVAVRFGVLLGALFVFPFPAGMVPGTARLALGVHNIWAWAVARFAEHVLRIEPPIFQMTGSGDTTWHWVHAALIVTLAAAGALVWSAIDRAPRPRLTAAMHTYLRYYVAAMMLIYGFAKVYELQFRTPWVGRYDQTIGEMSPMGLLWTFMGHSRAYTIFAGAAEVLGGALLLWRRTHVIGAFIVIAVMTNVVLLNFCYDVPVKLFSTELLVMAIAIAWPQLRRLVGAALGYRVDDVPPRPRGSAAGERLRLAAKLAMLAVLDGAALHLELALDDPPLLRTRGFHWISEAPFHR